MNASPSSSESQGTTTTGWRSPKQEEIIGRLIDKALGSLSRPSPVKGATVASNTLRLWGWPWTFFFKDLFLLFLNMCRCGGVCMHTCVQVPTEAGGVGSSWNRSHRQCEKASVDTYNQTWVLCISNHWVMYLAQPLALIRLPSLHKCWNYRYIPPRPVLCKPRTPCI